MEVYVGYEFILSSCRTNDLENHQLVYIVSKIMFIM